MSKACVQELNLEKAQGKVDMAERITSTLPSTENRDSKYRSRLSDAHLEAVFRVLNCDLEQAKCGSRCLTSDIIKYICIQGLHLVVQVRGSVDRFALNQYLNDQKCGYSSSGPLSNLFRCVWCRYEWWGCVFNNNLRQQNDPCQ